MNASSEKSRILIADDNEPNVELLEAYLTGVECEIAIAVDGRDTLDKVALIRGNRAGAAKRDSARIVRGVSRSTFRLSGAAVLPRSNRHAMPTRRLLRSLPPMRFWCDESRPVRKVNTGCGEG